jgi:hypothetical protein
VVGDLCRSHCWRLTTETATSQGVLCLASGLRWSGRHASVLPSPANLDQPPAGGEQAVDRGGVLGAPQPRRAPGRCGPAGALRTFQGASGALTSSGHVCRSSHVGSARAA